MREKPSLTIFLYLLMSLVGVSGSVRAQLPDDSCAVRYIISPLPEWQYDALGTCQISDDSIFTLAVFRDPSPPAVSTYLKSWITSSKGVTLTEHEYVRPGWLFVGNILNNVVYSNHNRILATARWGDTLGTHASAILLTFDREGNLIRSKEIGSDSSVSLSSIRELPNGNLLFAGSYHGISGPSKPIILVTDSLGGLVWQKGYEFPVSSTFTDAEFIVGHGIMATGLMYYTPISRFILNADTSGNSLWLRILDIGSFWADRLITGIREADSSGAIVFGTGVGSDGFSTLAWIGKINWTGGAIWNMNLGDFPDSSGIFGKIITDAVVNEDGSIVGTGGCYLGSNYRGLVVRVSQDGAREWVRQYSPFSFYKNEITGIEARPHGAGYLTCGYGATAFTGMRHDLWYMWLDPQGKLDTCGHVGVVPPIMNGMMVAFPNPANDMVTMQFPVALPSGGIIQLLSLQGSLVAEQSVPPGFEEVLIDTRSIPNGVYVSVLILPYGSAMQTKVAIHH